jgi:hypothetical protein
MSLSATFEITNELTVWDAWLVTISLLKILEKTRRKGQCDNFDENYKSIYRVYKIAEKHSVDQFRACLCGLSNAEHALLKRKIIRFYQAQVHFLKKSG